jgi:hypothetical protein
MQLKILQKEIGRFNIITYRKAYATLFDKKSWHKQHLGERVG